MRAEPPPWRDDDDTEPLPRPRRQAPSVRCPYLEQILRERSLLGLLTTYKADCHVDHRTHRFTGRHPKPPCISDPSTCRFYQHQWSEESHLIDRYRD